MGRFFKTVLLGSGIVVALLVIVAVAFAAFFDLNSYKPQIEGAVTKATGMQLKINGKAALSALPRLGITLNDVHLTNHGSPLFAANEIRATPRVFPFLFHRELILDNVSLVRPRIQVEKTANGRMNFETPKKPAPANEEPHPGQQAGQKGSAVPAGQVNAVSIKDGTVSYRDHKSGQNVIISGLDLNLGSLKMVEGAQPSRMLQSLSFLGEVRARSLRAGTIVASNLKADVRADRGIITLSPTTANIFGGDVRGRARADFRGKVPKLEIVQNATRIDLGQVAQATEKGPPKISGVANGSVSLVASGSDPQAIMKTANGNVSIHSDNLTVKGVNVDEIATNLKSGNVTDLAKLGGALVPGSVTSTLGQATGQAAGVAGGATHGTTEIRKLVSSWKIAGGLAQAKDVAFATDKTKVAAKGDINLVNQTYQNFYIATVDNKGCSTEKVGLEGHIKSPRPTTASVTAGAAKALAGKEGGVAGGIAGGLGNILGGGGGAKSPSSAAPEAAGGCDHFYSGSMAG